MISCKQVVLCRENHGRVPRATTVSMISSSWTGSCWCQNRWWMRFTAPFVFYRSRTARDRGHTSVTCQFDMVKKRGNLTRDKLRSPYLQVKIFGAGSSFFGASCGTNLPGNQSTSLFTSVVLVLIWIHTGKGNSEIPWSLDTPSKSCLFVPLLPRDTTSGFPLNPSHLRSCF